MSGSAPTKTPSYEKINYRIRPAKSIERKMLCESFRNLVHFNPIENYRYIGFGSPFFADFLLLHKQLGIKEMISIEKDIDNAERFNFNKPYKCIEMQFGESNDVLPEIIDESSRDIVWLDYDGHLDLAVLEDLTTVFFNIPSGSVVIISVNVHYRKGQELHLLTIDLEDKVPDGLSNKDLEFWKGAEVCRGIILNHINGVIGERNIMQEEEGEGKKYKFQQLYNFGYSDGAKMLTVGGIIYRENEEEIFRKCNFTQLPYIKESDEMYFIDIPSLTYKEIRNLDSQLPHESITEVNSPGIKEEDIKRYAELYKYFPTFSETEI